MSRTFVITLPDDLEQALTTQAQQSNQSPEDMLLQLVSKQLTLPPQPGSNAQQAEADPLLQLIGSLSVDIPDLAENHDYYIGQALQRESEGNE
ncbi:MAG: hypothetical protein AAGG51_25660 [Cyanobacteria bacterium P01_G01_bin.54]